VNPKYWDINKKFDKNMFLKLKSLGIKDLTAKVIAAKSETDESVENFLNPEIEGLHDPFLFKDMEKTVKQIVCYGESKKKILIYSDYDVDGITGCSMLVNFLKSLNYNISYYIPDRLDEGYGLSEQSVSNVINKAPELVITVDCGITAKEYVKTLYDNGIEVIVTDHHEVREDMVPDCFSIIAVSHPDCGYPFRFLCGAGVIFKVITALCTYLGLHNTYKEYLDLAALGTVADVVKLVGENRIIVKSGLYKLQNTKNIGLEELIRVSELNKAEINTYHLGYVLGPRLNAAGRMGSADRAVELLTCDDKSRCTDIAEEINKENLKRQLIQENIMKEADFLVKKQNDLEKDKILVIANNGWHHGIIGIVSSKITDKYCLPSILLSIEDEKAKGSGRSAGNFNLFKALSYADRYLEKYGGHEAAAGMSLKSADIDNFRIVVNNYANENADLLDFIPGLIIDTTVSLNEITLENIEDMDKLQPFGEGNKEPVFLCENMLVVYSKIIGKNRNHISVRFNQYNRYIDAVGFNLIDFYELLDPGAMVHVAFTLTINEWNGHKTPVMKIIDMKFADINKTYKLFYYHFTKNIEFEHFKGYNSIKELVEKIRYSYLTVSNTQLDDFNLSKLIGDITDIDRNTIALIYKYVKYKRPSLELCRILQLTEALTDMTGKYINPVKMLICLKILYDLGVVCMTQKNGITTFQINENITEKADVENSQLYSKMLHLRN